MNIKQKILEDTKQRFMEAYSKHTIYMVSFNDMLYFMNILDFIKPYPAGTTAQQLYFNIITNKY